jgi:hypothetical protein
VFIVVGLDKETTLPDFGSPTPMHFAPRLPKHGLRSE